MTALQKVLTALFVLGICLLTVFNLTAPEQTPESYLKGFHISVQKVLRHMRFAEKKSAQYETEQALKTIRAGIGQFPDRLDLRLSEIRFCQMIGQTDCMTNGIAATLEQAQMNRHNWEWSGNEKRGKSFMLSSFQGYQKNLWLAKEDASFQKNAEIILSFYPDNITSLDNLGVFYLERKEYDKAKEYLERAHLLNPDDKDVIAHLEKIPGVKKESPKPSLQKPAKPHRKKQRAAQKRTAPKTKRMAPKK